MHIALVHVRVIPAFCDAFITATLANQAATVQEPGNLRFDILRDPEQTEHFILYEAFHSAADAAAHKETPHYLAWRDTVADWMAEPRRAQPMQGTLAGHTQ